VRSAKCHGNPKPQARHQQARLDHGTELIKAWPVSSTCSLFPTTQRLGRQLSATGQRVRTSAAHSQHSVVNLHVSRIPQVAPVRIPRPSVPEECVRTRLTTLPGTNQRVVCNAANGHGPMASGVGPNEKRILHPIRPRRGLPPTLPPHAQPRGHQSSSASSASSSRCAQEHLLSNRFLCCPLRHSQLRDPLMHTSYLLHLPCPPVPRSLAAPARQPHAACIDLLFRIALHPRRLLCIGGFLG
jgi:hypothetical protein